MGATCLAALLPAGCAAPKFLSATTVQYPPFPDQTKTVEDPTKARIYLMRKEKFVAAAAGIQFYGSEPEVATGPKWGASNRMRLIGEVGPGSYLCWEETPHAFRLQMDSGNVKSTNTLDLKAGEVYYLRTYFHNGFADFSVRAVMLDEKAGQKMLKHLQPPNDYRKAK